MTTSLLWNCSTDQRWHFKDVGAKFMAQCLEYFNKDNDDEVTVLVATSGDTGGAVANGFLGTKGVNVVILYPSGKVSDIQEKQLTTLGQNIKALEVDGVFDDLSRNGENSFFRQRNYQNTHFSKLYKCCTLVTTNVLLFLCL